MRTIRTLHNTGSLFVGEQFFGEVVYTLRLYRTMHGVAGMEGTLELLDPPALPAGADDVRLELGPARLALTVTQPTASPLTVAASGKFVDDLAAYYEGE